MTAFRMAHISMQFSDTPLQMKQDVDRLFARAIKRKWQWFTGTEAGGSQAQPMPELLRAAADKNGYRFHIARGEWLCVDKNAISGGWESGYIHVLKANEGIGPHTDKGIAHVSFDSNSLGRISVGVGHYLTRGSKPGEPNYALNQKFTVAIGKWAMEKGLGKNVVFYHGDQNIVDRTEDTFLGQPLTSLWDELDKYENTGHGNIDVIATYDGDDRVSAVDIRALDDREFFLNTDHFLVEGEVDIAPLAVKAPQPVEHACPSCSHVHMGIVL